MLSNTPPCCQHRVAAAGCNPGCPHRRLGPTPHTTWLTFEVDFAFKSPLYRQVASIFFEEVRSSHDMGRAHRGRLLLSCAWTFPPQAVGFTWGRGTPLLQPAADSRGCAYQAAAVCECHQHTPQPAPCPPVPQVVQRMMGAFEGRCAQVYGPSSLHRRPGSAQPMSVGGR